jgi:hypothetical protein
LLTFIRDHLPSGRQLILGAEDTSGIDFSGETVQLTERYKVLQESEYDEVREELRPMLSKVLAPNL